MTACRVAVLKRGRRTKVWWLFISGGVAGDGGGLRLAVPQDIKGPSVSALAASNSGRTARNNVDVDPLFSDAPG